MLYIEIQSKVIMEMCPTTLIHSLRCNSTTLFLLPYLLTSMNANITTKNKTEYINYNNPTLMLLYEVCHFLSSSAAASASASDLFAAE